MVVPEHLTSFGFFKKYKNWTSHAESYFTAHGNHENRNSIDIGVGDNVVGSTGKVVGIPNEVASFENDELAGHDPQARSIARTVVDGENGLRFSYNTIMPCTAAFIGNNGSSYACDPLMIKQITGHVRKAVEDQFRSELEQMRARIAFLESRRSTADGPAQEVDESSGCQSMREVVEGGIPPSQQDSLAQSLSPQPGCSQVSSERVIDYSSEFTTHEIFKSRDALIHWTREVRKRHGFVIVIKASDSGDYDWKARLSLVCERGGHFKSKWANLEGQREKRKRIIGTKKCGCPFLLKGHKLAADSDWVLEVVCGMHYHSSEENCVGHSYAAGRLTRGEASLVQEMCKNMVRPKDILTTLNKRDELNVRTIRTIYSARHKFKLTKKRIKGS